MTAPLHSIYLDNSTTARPSGEALSKMLPYLTDKWGVTTQPHQMGQEVFPALEEAYHSIYQLLGASKSDQIVMTSSGAEAINQAILSTFIDVSLVDGKNHFITSTIDEAPAMISMHRIQALGGSTSFVKPNKEGLITVKNISDHITPRTAMIVLSYANGLTGVIQPIHEIAELCKLRGIRLLVDATHVLGKVYFDLNTLHVDFLAFNGEQLHAPKGTGGLYVKKGIKCSPFIVGGAEQQGLRAGSLNVPNVVALGVAAKQALEARDYLCSEVARLKYHFEKGIVRQIPEAQVLFSNEERVPHITSIAFPGVINETLLFLINRQKLYATIGGGSQQQISYSLLACEIPLQIAQSAISFSLSRETLEDDLDRAIKIIENAYQKMKKSSLKLFERKA